MTRCPLSCSSSGPTTQLSNKLAKKEEKPLAAKPICWVNIEEVPEMLSETTKAKQPPGFESQDSDDMSQGD